MKFGALSPTFTSLPSSVTGLPLNVTFAILIILLYRTEIKRLIICIHYKYVQCKYIFSELFCNYLTLIIFFMKKVNLPFNWKINFLLIIYQVLAYEIVAVLDCWILVCC